MVQTEAFKRQVGEFNAIINRHNSFLGKGKTLIEKVAAQITANAPLLCLLSQSEAALTFSTANIQIYARLEIPLDPGRKNPGHLVPYVKTTDENGKSYLEKVDDAEVSIDDLGNVSQTCNMDEGALLFLGKIMEFLAKKKPVVLY